MIETEETGIVNAHGQPMRRAQKPTKCACGWPLNKRVRSGSFGPAIPICPSCGHRFEDEVWREPEH